MMQTLEQNDQVVRPNHSAKAIKQPCARLSDAYQKEELKSGIKRAFETRNSYGHGNSVLSAICILDAM